MKSIRSPEFEALHRALEEALGGLLLDSANEPRTLKVMTALQKRGYRLVRVAPGWERTDEGSGP